MINDLTVCDKFYGKFAELSVIHFFHQQSFEEAEKQRKLGDEPVAKPDPLSQLVVTFCRGAMTERSGALQEDPLYMSYAHIVAKSCGEEPEEEEEEESEEGEKSSIHVSCVHNKKKQYFSVN